MDYKARFKEIVREDLGLNGRIFSKMFGIDYSYYRKVTQRKGFRVVNWVRMFVIAFELGKAEGLKKGDPSGDDINGEG